MKKFKHIVPFLLALVMALAIPLAGCSSCDDDEVKGPTLQSISLNTDNVKKEYLYGEIFTAEGLVVTASVQQPDSEEPEEKVLTSDEYTLDSSAYRRNDYGEHDIIVSYTLNGVTKRAEYTVTVVEALRKLEVDASNAKTVYYNGINGDKFSSENLVVKAYLKKAGSSELEEKTLTSSDYTIDSKALSTRAGTYEIKVSYTYEDFTKNTSYKVKVVDVLDRIELDLTNVTTKFYADSLDVDEFTTEGVAAKAFVWNKVTNELEEKVLTADDIDIDTTAYKNEVGIYPIVVSYTYEGIKKSATYEVAFLPSMDGLFVALDEDTADTYTLTAEKKEVELDVSKIVVKEANRDGTIGAAVTDYDVKLYKGGVEITLTNGKANVDAGAYNILVQKASERHLGYMRAGFAVVYVNDTMVNFELKGGTFMQESGQDIISDTWVFTATYISGATKEIPSSACKFDIDTMTVAENVKTKVTYVDYNAKGESVERSLDVTYTIERRYGKLLYSFDYNAIDNSEMPGDQTPLKQSDLKGVNSFLKVTGDASDKVLYRNKTLWGNGANVIEIRNVGFLVTFEGTGTITIGFSSTGGSNDSSISLMDSEGNFITATSYDTNITVNTNKDEKQHVAYVVNGTSPSEVTFTITKPGVYKIVGDINKCCGRNTRIHSIEMEDNVERPETASEISLTNIEYDEIKGKKA